MSRALWLLQWLTISSGFRRTWRNLHTVKGTLSAAATLFFFGSALAGLIFARMADFSSKMGFETSEVLEKAERYGTRGLLVLCLLTIFSTSGKASI